VIEGTLTFTENLTVAEEAEKFPTLERKLILTRDETVSQENKEPKREIAKLKQKASINKEIDAVL